MKCQKCGNEQEEGRFCELCGGDLTQGNKETTQATTVNSSTSQGEGPNEAVERVKKVSSAYWGYFLHFLKSPTSKREDGADNYKNGIINIIIAAGIISLSFYNMVKFDFGFISYSPSFGKFFFNTLLGLLIATAISLGLILVISIFFSSKKWNFQKVIANYGAKLSPVIALSLAMLLFLILEAWKLATLLFFLVIITMFLLIPLYLVSTLLDRYSQTIDPFYGYLIYFVAFWLSLYLVMTLFADSNLFYWMTDIFTIINM